MYYNNDLDVEVTISGPEGFRPRTGSKTHLRIPGDSSYAELLTRVKEWAVGDFTVDVMLFRPSWSGGQVQICDDATTRDAIGHWSLGFDRSLFVIVSPPPAPAAGAAAAAAAGSGAVTNPAPASAKAPAAAPVTTTTTTTTTTNSVGGGSGGSGYSLFGSDSGPCSIIPDSSTGSLSPHQPSHPEQNPAQTVRQRQSVNPPTLTVYTPPGRVEESRVVSPNADPLKLWNALRDNCGNGSLLISMTNATIGLDDAVKRNQTIEMALKDNSVQAAYTALCQAWIAAIQERRKAASPVPRTEHTRSAYDNTEPAAKTRSAYDDVTSSSSLSGSVVRRLFENPYTHRRGKDVETVTFKWDVKNDGDRTWDASQLELHMSRGQSTVVKSYSIPNGLQPGKIGILSITFHAGVLNQGTYVFKWDVCLKRTTATVLSGLEFTLNIIKDLDYSSGYYHTTPPRSSGVDPYNSHADVYAQFEQHAGPAMAAAAGLSSSQYAPSAPREDPSARSPPAWDSNRMTDGPAAVERQPSPPAYNAKKSDFSAEVVQDVTLRKDGTHNKLCLGKSRVKIWRVRNTGTSEWPAGCSLVPMDNSVLRVKEVSVPRAKPNEQVDVFAVLEISDSAYSSYGDLSVRWMLIDPSRDSMLETPLNLDINIGVDTSSYGRTDRIIDATWDHARFRS